MCRALWEIWRITIYSSSHQGLLKLNEVTKSSTHAVEFRREESVGVKGMFIWEKEERGDC